jgi:branched-chain amino acid transport system ATP-binding protein
MLLLDIRKVSIHFGGIMALKDIDLQVQSGEIHGLIGPNGAGKTTLLNLISGTYPADSGEISINGNPIHTRKAYERPSFGISRTFQTVNIFGNISTVDNVKVGFHTTMKSNILKYCLRSPSVTQEEKEIHRKAMDLLEFVGLEQYAQEKSKNLAYGHQKLLEIARAMACNPALLLLDEPGTGMNPNEKEFLKNCIKEIKGKGMTTILIEHDMGFVMDLCNPISVLDSGAKIAEGSPAEIRTNPKVVEAYLGKRREDVNH